jgi:hypothetical protein
VAVLVAGVSLAIFFALFRPSGVQAATIILTVLSGDVQVREAGSDVLRPAVDGEELRAGDGVRTGGAARAVVTFFDGSTVELEPGTDMTIERVEAEGRGRFIRLSQALGTTWHHVTSVLDGPSEYAVETPAAVAAVRDTLFQVTVLEDGTSTVIVKDGSVAVAAAGEEVLVRAGQETTVQPGNPPATPTFSSPPRSEIRLRLGSPAWIVVSDPGRRSVGIVPPGVGINQLPGAWSDEPEVEPQEVLIPNPVSGTHLISIGAKGGGGAFTLTAGALNGELLAFLESTAGSVGAGERWEARLEVEVVDGRVTGLSLSGPTLASGPPPGQYVLTEAATERAEATLAEVLGGVATPGSKVSGTMPPASATPATPSPDRAPTVRPGVTPQATRVATPVGRASATPRPAPLPTPRPTPAAPTAPRVPTENAPTEPPPTRTLQPTTAPPPPTPAPTLTTKISVGSATVASGGSVTVALQAQAPPPGIGAYTVDILFDSTVVSATGCSPHSSGMCNPSFAADTVRVTGASVGGLAGSIRLASITFEAAGAAGTFSVLDIQVRELFGSDLTNLLPVPTNAGRIDIGS